MILLRHPELSEAIFGIDHDIALGQQHALRHPRGAGGVDDGDDIVLGDLIDLLFDLLLIFIRQGRADFRQLIQGTDREGTVTQERFKGNHQIDVGQLIFHRVEFFVLGLGGAENDSRLTVIDDIGRLLAGVGGIDRHGDAAGALDAEIGNGPAEAILGEDRHLVAGGHRRRGATLCASISTRS